MKKNLLTFSLSLFAAARMFALPPLLGDTSYKASSVDNLDFNMSWENLQIKNSPDDNIKKIIMPWPNQVQATSGIWYHDRLNDQYIVEQTNGKYAVATLHFSNDRDITHPYDTRQSVTNGLLKRRPCLRIRFTVYEGDTETIEKIEQYKNHPNQPPL